MYVQRPLSPAKSAWRLWARAQGRALSLAERSRASAAICARLLALVQPQERVLVYQALSGEPALDAFALVHQQGGGHLDWLAQRPAAPVAPCPAPHVVLCPGLCFAGDGTRLGRGGGFYDRLLADARCTSALRIGVCFAQQFVDWLPSEPFDMAMDVVVTELAAHPTSAARGRALARAPRDCVVQQQRGL